MVTWTLEYTLERGFFNMTWGQSDKLLVYGIWPPTWSTNVLWQVSDPTRERGPLKVFKGVVYEVYLRLRGGGRLCAYERRLCQLELVPKAADYHLEVCSFLCVSGERGGIVADLIEGPSWMCWFPYFLTNQHCAGVDPIKAFWVLSLGFLLRLLWVFLSLWAPIGHRAGNGVEGQSIGCAVLWFSDTWILNWLHSW